MINANHLKLASFFFRMKAQNSVVGPVLVSLGFHNKAPQTKGLKQQKHIFSWFWRLEVQDQGSIRVGFFQGFSWGLGCGRLLTVLSHCFPSVCVLISLQEHHQSNQIRAHPCDLIQLNHLVNWPYFQMDSAFEVMAVRAPRCGSGEGHSTVRNQAQALGPQKAGPA